MTAAIKVLALSGGIGGAKLARGLYRVLDDHQLGVVCNTGDDFEHFGLTICPDFDTVLYTLADVANTDTGWGLAGETWQFMQAMVELGGEGWFQLGDKDLATHVVRTQKLKSGQKLDEIGAHLCQQFGLRATIVPATNDPVRTVVQTADGPLPFQHYFVRDQCSPVVSGFEFHGASTAKPLPWLLQTLKGGTLDAIVICPSNPYISIDPILSLPGLTKAIKDASAPVLAVSPIVGGDAVKGPTAKMMRELGLAVSSATVASHYADIIDVLVLDQRDHADVEQISKSAEMDVRTTDTLMKDDSDKIRLAEFVLNAL